MFGATFLLIMNFISKTSMDGPSWRFMTQSLQ